MNRCLAGKIFETAHTFGSASIALETKLAPLPSTVVDVAVASCDLLANQTSCWTRRVRAALWSNLSKEVLRVYVSFGTPNTVSRAKCCVAFATQHWIQAVQCGF